MELAVTTSEFLLVQKKRIILESESVEDIKLVFLGNNESVVDEGVESKFEIGLSEIGEEDCFGGVVEEVSCSDIVVFFVVDDGGLEAVEGEEVIDTLGGGVLSYC